MTKYSPVEAKPPPKSGMRRLVSYDARFFIRCIQSEHVAEMHRFLKEYHQVIAICIFFKQRILQRIYSLNNITR